MLSLKPLGVTQGFCGRAGKTLALVIVALSFVTTPLGAQDPIVWIEGAKLQRPSGDVWTASFWLDALPPAPIFLFLKLKSSSGPDAHCRLEIFLNGTPIAQGQIALSGSFWRYQRFPVPAGCLLPGLCSLRVKSGEKGTGNAAPPSLEISEFLLADHRFAPRLDLMTDFTVEVPETREESSSPPPDRKPRAFALRGTKGWAWTPEQYLEEIPFLIQAKMNFLMNCYTSMFSSLDPFSNRWWEPLPEDKKNGFERVVRACQQSGIDFCFSMHPQLFSEHPLELNSDADFEKLWPHYAWMQGLGVKWFNLCYDDIGVEGLEKSDLGEAHARLVNRLLSRLREKTPDAKVIFCPTYYAGCGDAPDVRAYLEALGQRLSPEVYLFWTGDGVVTPRITRACASAYHKIVNHRLIVWDNYPVNDRNPTLHLGPVTGRDPDLCDVASGYMSNPLCPQNEVNRIPLFTCADYALNPGAYDPLRSIGKAIRALAPEVSQRQALERLVELYPGMLLYGETGTGYNPVLERFRALRESPDGRSKAEAFKERVKRVIEEFDAAFPGRYARTKETIRSHLERMKDYFPTI
jgi:hypothetical protein